MIHYVTTKDCNTSDRIWNILNPSFFNHVISQWLNSDKTVTVFRISDFQLDNSFFIQDNNNWITNLAVKNVEDFSFSNSYNSLFCLDFKIDA